MSRVRYRDAGMNDPACWAHAHCELPPESFMDHEEFYIFYTLPFDLCLELNDGDKWKAKALYWGQWTKLNANGVF